MKQAIIVRTDLDMGKGKIAGQAAHAAQLATKMAETYHLDWYVEWMQTRYRKIVLKVSSEAELNSILKQALDAGLPAVIINDAGFTQLQHNTPTCVGIGPCPDEMLDKITGGLKLL